MRHSLKLALSGCASMVRVQQKDVIDIWQEGVKFGRGQEGAELSTNVGG